MSVAARLHPPIVGPEPTVVEAQAVLVEEPHYIGLVTRAIAFGIDAALINVVALLTGAIVALTFSVLTIPGPLKTIAIAVGGFVYLLWAVGYFVVFWSTTGQTPGSRVMRIRVVTANGERLLPRRGLLRFIGLTLAAIPLFAGFLWIVVDSRRRGLQDLIARTLVVDAEPESDG
jgi:uncharacterized RDD family membrane protein YckC